MSDKLKKSSLYFSIFLLLVIMFSMYYVINQNKAKVELYFQHNDNINVLMNYNNYFNSFLLGQKDFVVFDEINKRIDHFGQIIDTLHNEASQISMNQQYIDKLKKLRSEINHKELWIERYKARKAFESKILFFILDKQSSKKANLDFAVEEQLNDLRVDLLNIIHLNRNVDNNIFSKYTLNAQNLYIATFIKQVTALQDNLNFQNKYIDVAINEDIDKNLTELKELLLDQRLKTKTLFFTILNVFAFFILIVTLWVIYFFIRLTKTKDQLGAFRKAVENSDNVIVMTDKDSNITFANEAFEKISGYSKEEALGQNPKVLKSGYQDENFYKDLNETIHSGNTWKGRFINKKKNGETFYENATITPIFSDGKIDGYLAIKLDVTESVMHAQELDNLNKSLEKRVEESVAKLREKDNVILNQTKMAALGEMIGNIAHQWRQPLSIITAAATGLKLENQINILTDERLENTCDNINENAQYLSKTIDDFRNFIKGESKSEQFDLKELIQSFINLVDSSIKKYQINMILDIPEHMNISNLKNELNQCLINLFNNSKDIMIEKEVENKHIKITTAMQGEKVIISFQDNGGGIPEDIIDKIFEPYFTTKHQSIGTGLGLNMVYRLITEGMHGSIYVSNEKMRIDDKEYLGAKFIIELPVEKK